MHTARRFLVTIVVPALIVSIFAVGAAAAHGSDGKVTLCHFADHKFVKITVSMNAKPAHMQHGDVDPDEYGDCSGDHNGDHEGNQEGNHGGHDGDPSKCQGARHKWSQVVHAGSSSGKGGGGGQSSKSHGDKA
jgi:hypothetical protein